MTYSSKLRKWKAEELEDTLDPEEQDDDIVMVDAPSRDPESTARSQGSPMPKEAVSHPQAIHILCSSNLIPQTLIIGPDIIREQETFRMILEYDGFGNIVVPKGCELFNILMTPL